MKKTLILCLLGLFPMTAQAQTGKHVSIGAAVGWRNMSDSRFSTKNPSPAFLYRFSRNPNERKQGWVWRLGGTVGYTHADFSSDIGGADTKMGRLQTIAVLGGIERAYRHDRFKVGASVLAGPTFNSFAVDNAAREAYENRLGVPLEEVKVHNSLAVRSGVGTWYDVNNWVGVHAGVYKWFGQTTATTTAGGVSTEDTWKNDKLTASMGIAFGIF
ncbi:MAG TPA: hypothetical protein VFY90_07375 [Tepidiformaceae bacterium]|jgi:hypothetical protein|nr:hypothetical protein [Candidatus Eisenbacteria bacterium]HEX6031236.1 hypothetical protein [Tepidiformaceae bacterium]